jgi:hypothetical protein
VAVATSEPLASVTVPSVKPTREPDLTTVPVAVSGPLAWGLNQLVSAGLKPPPPQRYPLAKGSAALQALADGGVYGKVVLEP